jgi:hypothetical protein
VPTSPEVFLESKAPFTAYVYQYGGWAPRTDAEMSAMAANLSSDVRATPSDICSRPALFRPFLGPQAWQGQSLKTKCTFTSAS